MSDAPQRHLQRGMNDDSLTREAWISGAWDMLGENGLDGVRVEPLAKSLGVTKGSFIGILKLSNYSMLYLIGGLQFGTIKCRPISTVTAPLPIGFGL